MDLRTGFAYWPLRNGLLASYPRLDRDESADVTIVGAGITGALAAYELTHAGADVVVVDTRDVASGSSAATTGLLLCETDTSLLELSHRVGEAAAARAYHLGLEAIGRIESLTVSLADSCGFARRSSLYLASTSDAARTLEREYALRRRHGIGVALLDSANIHRQVGHRRSECALQPRCGNRLLSLRASSAVSCARPWSADLRQDDGRGPEGGPRGDDAVDVGRSPDPDAMGRGGDGL